MSGSALAAAVAAGGCVLALSPARPSRARLDAAAIPDRRAASKQKPRVGVDPGPTRGRLLASGLAGLAATAVVGGVVGIAIGTIAGLGIHRVLSRLEPQSVARERARMSADLPACALLLAGAIEAGASTLDALEIVAIAIGGPVAPHLTRAAARLRLGADPARVWADIDPGSGLAPLARTVSRAQASGAPLADALGRLGLDLQERRRHDIDRRARAVGVRAAAPLGLCFLPAFLLIGVVPVVIGMAQQILTGVL